MAAVAARPAGTRRPKAGQYVPSTVRAYPNPAHDLITLELANLAAPAAQVRLVAAATGQRVLTVPVSGTERATVSVAGLDPGLYQAQVLDATGHTVGTCKIAVLH